MDMKLETWKESLKKLDKSMALKYFKLEEFDDAPGTGKNMKMDFLLKLDKARDIAGIPFKITSGWRSEETNKRVGGVSNSSHLKGLASDLACNDSNTRQKIVNALIMAGFTRIGIAKTFIHCDTDNDKPDAIWIY